jgi:hypothetical protein
VETQPLYRVRNWDLHHENNRSRGITRTQWVPVPNDLSGDGYVDLVAHDDGAAHLGVWIGLLMVASRANPRGCLVREDGRPHRAESLARVTRLPEDVIRVAIERLLTIGLLEIVVNNTPPPENGPSAAKPQDGAGESHSAASNPQGAAPKPHECAVEGKGTEHHHQEEKRKEKEQQRKEPDGTERAREGSTTEGSDARSGVGSDFPQKGDDEAENLEVPFASPEDELKAIYQSKAGESITVEVLDSIRINLELTRVKHGGLCF